MRYGALVALFVALAWNNASAGKFVLPQGCTLPFESIEGTNLAIDKKCDADGNAGDDKKKQLEDEAKNDFCVVGDPIDIDYSDFTKLQSSSDADPSIRKDLQDSRDRVAHLRTLSNGKTIGEGTLVRFRAYLMEAHYSNVGKVKSPKKPGEVVNCNHPEEEWNDIHIQLVKNATEDDDCKCVTAEMSPHFRPDSWINLVDLHIGRPVRVTGPLFFDNSHQPCHEKKRPSPHRISVWEIHPIYQFDVCANASEQTCDVSNDAVWIPLDQWHNHREDDEQPN